MESDPGVPENPVDSMIADSVAIGADLKLTWVNDFTCKPRDPSLKTSNANDY